MEIKAVCIMELGKELNGTMYKKNARIKLPKKTKVSVDFDDEVIVGEATNFVRKDGKIFCDIKLNTGIIATKIGKQIGLTVAPRLLFDTNMYDPKTGYENVRSGELDSCSVISCGHADSLLTGNFQKKKKVKRVYRTTNMKPKKKTSVKKK